MFSKHSYKAGFLCHFRYHRWRKKTYTVRSKWNFFLTLMAFECRNRTSTRKAVRWSHTYSTWARTSRITCRRPGRRHRYSNIAKLQEPFSSLQMSRTRAFRPCSQRYKPSFNIPLEVQKRKTKYNLFHVYDFQTALKNRLNHLKVHCPIETVLNIFNVDIK